MKPQKTVLLGMSGGVDSSVTCLLLQKQGYKVIGAFLKMFSETKNKLTGECNWREEERMAKIIANKLNIKLITLDYENIYKNQVVDPMFKAYQSGLTPNPDLACNNLIKFPLLWKEAKKLKCDYIATGHYAQIKHTKSEYHLLQGKDKTKDQSYFLAMLSQQDLEHTLFPIGNLTKEKIRQIAKSNNFPNWDKHGSAGVCFIGNINFQNFLKQRIKEKPGKVINPENDVLGTHQGIQFYTIGQKAGTHNGINIEKPHQHATSRYYISEKRKNNLLVVAPEGHPALKRKEITIKDLHLINKKENIPSNLKARIRHLGQLHSGKLIKKSNKYHFIFSKPVDALAEGQYVVLYNKQQVIGSGEIRLK